MREAYQRPAARRDLIEHYAYLFENADETIADRFLVSAEETYFQLAQDPQMGSPVAVRAAGLAGLRKWRIRDFPNVLVFYHPRPTGVSIVRVLHAHQDWWTLLAASQ